MKELEEYLSQSIVHVQ